MKKYIFDNFKNNKKYKKKVLQIAKSITNLEIGGNKFYDGLGNHYMQNPNEITNFIFFLKNYEKKRKLKIKSFLEIGFATGMNNTFLNKFFKFKNLVAIDYVQPAGINTNVFFSNLRFKNLTLICGNSKDETVIKKTKLLGNYDLIFIDGGHDYETIRSDYKNYSKFLNENGIIAIHDIYADSLGVKKFWKNLKIKEKKKWNFLEFFNPGQKINYGIGVLIPKK